jgi:curved DNA-binding protein CbpA
MKLKNYYKILNIQKNASNDQIKEGYRKLVKFWHPDVNQSSNSHEKFIEINEAFEILKDKDKRIVYDRFYDEYFRSNASLEPNQKAQGQSNNERYAEYRYETKTSDDFEYLQNWINQAKIRADELIKLGLKKIDTTLETGFYVIGEVGNFISVLFVIGIFGTIGFLSLKYIIDLISGINKFSLLELFFSLLGIVISLLVFFGLTKVNFNDD